MMSRFVFLLVLLPSFFITSDAFALSSAWQDHGNGRVRLIGDIVSGEENRWLLGLDFQMEKGWKVYWQFPGITGFPPDIAWNTPDKDTITAQKWYWPYPKRFSIFGIESLGYEKSVTIPIDITFNQPLDRLQGSLSFLTCKDVCIPITFDIDEALTPSNRDIRKKIDTALLLSPKEVDLDDASEKPFELVFLSWQQGVAPDEIIVTGLLNHETTRFPNTKLFLSAGAESFFDAAKVQFLNGRQYLRFSSTALLAPEAFAEEISYQSDLPVTLHLLFDGQPLDLQASALYGLPPNSDVSALGNLIPILGFALLAGIILNAMPCVFPVLSLKILAIIKHSGSQTHTIRRSFLASQAGMVTGFLILGFFVAGLSRGLGLAGWGFQFQSPLFIVFMMAILVIFGLNALGLFQITLPARFLPLGTHSSDFVVGVFLPVIAASCSAPFLGAAIGFALTRQTSDIIAIFAMLGVGMAAPWTILTFKPSWIGRLPRPGAWMNVAKNILGILLLLTALWMAFLLYLQLSSTPQKLSQNLPWQRFEESAIQENLDAGRLVFVDVTARWCISCQTNKFLVLERPPTSAWLSNDKEVILLQADWTKPDADIARFLSRYERFGVPFNIVFSPNIPQGIILPPILTRAALKDALQRAGLKSLQ